MGSNKDFAFVAPGADGYDKDHPLAAHIQIKDTKTGELDWPEDRKKIAICGFASSSRHRMPFDDPTAVIVGLNQIYRHIPREDVHFDIHLHWEEDNVEGTDHPRWVRECGIPVFMADPPADQPTAVRYPVERMIAKHGIDYFTSTVAFMLAWSVDIIDQQVAKRLVTEAAGSAANVLSISKSLYAQYTVGVYGIDLIVGTEYEWQKACVEFWLGVAEGRGIQIDIAPESALLKQLYRYGYQKEPDGILKLSELGKRNGELSDRMKKIMAEYQTLDGALQENQHISNVMNLRLRGGQIPLGNG